MCTVMQPEWSLLLVYSLEADFLRYAKVSKLQTEEDAAPDFLRFCFEHALRRALAQLKLKIKHENISRIHFKEISP